MATPSSVNARLFYRAAKERFDDAEFLLNAGRTTAAVYLAGYGVECILKALILAQAPRAREKEILAEFKGARAHQYDWLRERYAEFGGPGLPREVALYFAHVEPWSTNIRYSPASVPLQEAKVFLNSVSEIFIWGDGRLS